MTGKNHLIKSKEKIPFENIKKKLSKNNNHKMKSISYGPTLESKIKRAFKTIEEDQILESKIKKRINNIKIKRENKRLSPNNKNINRINKSEKILQNYSNISNSKENNNSNRIKASNNENILVLNSSNNKKDKIINRNNNNIKKVYNSNDNNLNIVINNKHSKIIEEKNNNFKTRIISTSKSTNFENNTYDLKLSENTKLNKSYSESDLGEVGEIIEDEGESEIENELNELGENHFINNPKSIIPDSLFNLKNKKEKKRQSLSVSKEVSKFDKNFFIFPIKEFIFKKIEKHKFEKLKIITDINELNDKIQTKNKEIERYKKLIENVKMKIKKCDYEFITIEEWIQKEQKKGDKLQQMINYFTFQ